MADVFYNEIDPHAARWLRNLIAQGAISPGVVDERDIRDIQPSELMNYDRAHFFSGIGVWDYALNEARWPSGCRVWTGSPPCQPFSAAGKGGGFDDERHLWPAYFYLISQCRPDTIFGEQVASKDGLNWFDLVRSDLEGSGYAVGVQDTCAAGHGAPHIRQRLFFVADADGGNASAEREQRSGQLRQQQEDGRAGQGEPGPTNGFWGASDWIGCTDGRWRAVESFAQQMAHGAPSRVGYGGSGFREEKEGALNEHADQDRSAVLPELRSAAGTQTVRQSSGGLQPLQGAEVLRPAVHGDGYGGRDESRQRQERQASSGEDAATGLRGVRSSGSGARSSYRLGTDEQRAGEPNHPLPFMSQAYSFPLVEGAAFKQGSGHPLFEGKSRAKMLRGYGNAIVAPVAAEFIRAYLSVRA